MSTGNMSINRNIVECKGHRGRVSYRLQLSINRNIVECKGNGIANKKASVRSINRNIVECKDWKHSRSM